MKLPSIIDQLPKQIRQRIKEFKFVQPAVGEGIKKIFTDDTPTSPKSEVFAIRELTLGTEDIIPFHAHSGKEKMYICQSRECRIQIIILQHGEFTFYELKRKDDTVIIPPGCPHAVICDSFGTSEIRVITTSQDASDIIWEEATDQLITNKHRQNH